MITDTDTRGSDLILKALRACAAWDRRVGVPQQTRPDVARVIFLPHAFSC